MRALNHKNYIHVLANILTTFLFITSICGQTTYINPVISGDHPDPTLTKIGDDFYSSGSSFNPTPKIYHSTDLVHWEVVAQPVSASWTSYGNSPGGGIWGGHMVFYSGSYWHFFGKGGGSMYFVKADKPEGPWSSPTKVNVPSGLWSLGVDNSIFIDDDNKWYMLTKAGQQNNHIVELNDKGQPSGKILDLTWLNPDSEGNPYGWAEGPVMWKRNGYYYYSFAQHLAGSQYVMRSDTLTDDKSKWTVIGTNIFTGTVDVFSTPNHISPAVELNDGTSWIIAHSYRSNYYAHGRQGLLCQLVYDLSGFPKILRPSVQEKNAPGLPSSGIPWMVPHSDNFNSEFLNPEWSFLGYTPANTWSLTNKPGWLKLSPNSSGKNTVIKNDGEHNFSLITKVDFEPSATTDEAGLWIVNGPETHQVKVVSTINSEGQEIIAFSFEDTRYETENTAGSLVWLKLVRNEHQMSGYFSADGFYWTPIGAIINAIDIDKEQSDYNNFTGNQQGLYVKGRAAYFDLYIYRDGYTAISAANPANKFRTSVTTNSNPPNTLVLINNDDWTMYAGVEFGNDEYQKRADSISVTASSSSTGGTIEVILDSLAGTKIAEIKIKPTGSWGTFNEFTSELTQEVSGYHDVYLKFLGSENVELFRLKTITLIDKDLPTSSVGLLKKQEQFELKINNSVSLNSIPHVEYYIPRNSNIALQLFDINGTIIKTLYQGYHLSGTYTLELGTEDLSGGVYLCRLKSGNYSETKKIIMIK